MRNIVLGTAGHVDHGKTSLIKALTGINTDRLKEERERGISIDIGFAHYSLPSGRVIEIVDVPGHERFVRNMLRGISGADLTLLVVAGDDGVMPQTVEHLEILRLLGVEYGIVAITKIDLVDDEMVSLVTDEVRRLTAGTFLENAPIVPCSSADGTGLSEIARQLDRVSDSIPGKDQDRAFRMPVDKVYSVPGYGTIATGTVASGTVKQGEELEICPNGLRTRARGIQAHKERVAEVGAGQRAGLNLTGADAGCVRRGMVVAAARSTVSSHILNARLVHLESTSRPLAQRERLKLYAGTSEVGCRIVLMDRDELGPGESALVQLRLEAPVTTVPFDRFIVRSLSPARTVAGGTILEVNAAKWRRRDPRLIEELGNLEPGQDRELVRFVVKRAGLAPLGSEAVGRLTGLTRSRVEEIAQGLVENRSILRLPSGALASADCLSQAQRLILDRLDKECRQAGLRRGLTKDELRSKIGVGLDGDLFEQALSALVRRGQVVREGREVALPHASVRLTQAQERIYAAAEALCSEDGLRPVRFVSLRSAVPEQRTQEIEEVLRYMARLGRITVFDDLSFISVAALDAIKERLSTHLRMYSTITLGEARDVLDVGRNPLQTILAHLDRIGFTRRRGDQRVLARRHGG